MTRPDWTNRTSNQQAFARAGGRRAYNKLRQEQATIRRLGLWDVLRTAGRRYTVREVAAMFDVSASTAARDLRALLTIRGSHCPLCGGPTPQARLWHQPAELKPA